MQIPAGLQRPFQQLVIEDRQERKRDNLTVVLLLQEIQLYLVMFSPELVTALLEDQQLTCYDCLPREVLLDVD